MEVKKIKESKEAVERKEDKGKQVLYDDRKWELATETDSTFYQRNQSHLDIFNSYIPHVKSAIDKQHSIAARVTEGTFTSDKVLMI